MQFETYPFEKLTGLLEGITPDPAYRPITLTIGEPQFATPLFIQDTLRESAHLLNRYPKTAGEASLRHAQRAFVARRFGVDLRDDQIIPTFGTREVLFNFPQFLLFDKKEPVMAFTNPFYQIYEGAAIASRAQVEYINLTKENGFRAIIDPEQLRTCDFVILNFPNNPTAASMDIDGLAAWVEAALTYDFVLLNDECYSEIYTGDKHPSLLEASIRAGNPEFRNILVVNSVSKRSSAPGLRSGFIAGDAKILKDYMRYRTYVGCASPLPMQEAAAQAWEDEKHVVFFREKYSRNFEIAREVLGITVPDATFYLWLEVEDDLAFTRTLYKEKNVKVLPGSFLSRGDLREKYVRIALVEDEERTAEALERIKPYVK